MLKTRLNRCTHVIDPRRSTGVGDSPVTQALRAPCPPLWGRDQRPVLAVRRKHPMEAGQVDSGLGHQAHQSGDQVQRLKDHMGGAVPVRRLQPVTDVAIGGQRQTLFSHHGP